MSDVIVAKATGTVTSSAVSIVRLSGDGALNIAEKVFTCRGKITDRLPNTMILGTINGKMFFEQAFCVYYKTPKSYTGEDVIEFQCHGGSFLSSAVVDLCIENGARPADPGEFTKRAFLNGKLNLSQAEGVMDMINAQSEGEILQAYRAIKGELSKGIERMENVLCGVIALLEGKLDYPEEMAEEGGEVSKELQDILAEINELLRTASLSGAVKGGVNVAIVGLPNVGKSSLLNALIAEERAIVTEIAGTTRDVLRESVIIKGIRFNFSDTAGIREESRDIIEKIGIERSKEVLRGADLILFVTDGSKAVSTEETKLLELIGDKPTLYITNKGDILLEKRKDSIIIEAKNNINIDKIRDWLLQQAGHEKIFSENILTNERHIFALKKSAKALEEAISSLDELPIECSLVDIKTAYSELAKITGKEADERIVDEIFSRFCVGK